MCLQQQCAAADRPPGRDGRGELGPDPVSPRLLDHRLPRSHQGHQITRQGNH